MSSLIDNTIPMLNSSEVFVTKEIATVIVNLCTDLDLLQQKPVLTVTELANSTHANLYLLFLLRDQLIMHNIQHAIWT